YRCLGYLIRFGRWTIFHPGDAIPYDGMVERLLGLQAGRTVDVALMPINGRLPERRVTGNFWGREAAQLPREINARIVLPRHDERFTFNPETPQEFVESCTRLGQRHAVLRCGERWTHAAE
ncbi:MAG: MBL fold metallo-hydrolase, partial [Acidobacteriota bacterium]